ncbi:hypothetical protein Ndes2526B_g06672 [Nannochloris sp. 'desiccata']
MSVRAVLGHAARHSAAGVASLKESPRDLLLIFVLKVLESYNYFSLSRILTLYLSEQFGISDMNAGSILGSGAHS